MQVRYEVGVTFSPSKRWAANAKIMTDSPVARDAEHETYLRVKSKRDEYRQRCASANLSNTITRQQDIDGANMESYCRAYEKTNNLPQT